MSFDLPSSSPARIMSKTDLPDVRNVVVRAASKNQIRKWAAQNMYTPIGKYEGEKGDFKCVLRRQKRKDPDRQAVEEPAKKSGKKEKAA